MSNVDYVGDILKRHFPYESIWFNVFTLKECVASDKERIHKMHASEKGCLEDTLRVVFISSQPRIHKKTSFLDAIGKDDKDESDEESD